MIGVERQHLAVDAHLAFAIAPLAHRARKHSIDAQVAGIDPERIAQGLVGFLQLALPLLHVGEREAAAQLVGLVHH